MATRCASPWKNARKPPSKAQIATSKHSRFISEADCTIKYHWEAAIPYNWTAVSRIPLEKAEKATAERNLYESLCEKKRFILDLCQPADTVALLARSRSVRTATLQGRRSEENLRPQVPRVIACLNPSKSRFRRSASPSSTEQDMGLSLNVTRLRPKTQEMPFAIHRYAFPHAQKAGKAKQTEARSAFKNKEIEQYLTRFERKKKNPQIVALTKEGAREWRFIRSIPKMVNVSVQDSGLPTLREDPTR